jgi:methyl halide transferase
VPAAIPLPAPLKSDGSRRKVLVPGCGRGFDVVLFASRGYDAVGLEVSANAAEAARKYIAEPGDGPLEKEYIVKDASVGRGKTEVVEGDYFADEWRKGVAEGQFDIIYDNTVCLLHRYAVSMTMLINE